MSGDLARISETAYESKLLLKDNLALDVGCENRGNLNLVHKIQANLSGVIYAKVFHLHNENYNLIVVSSEFAGKPMKVQHRLVQKAIEEEVTKVKSLRILTLTPEAWEAQRSMSTIDSATYDSFDGINNKIIVA